MVLVEFALFLAFAALAAPFTPGARVELAALAALAATPGMTPRSAETTFPCPPAATAADGNAATQSNAVASRAPTAGVKRARWRGMSRPIL